MTTNSSSVEILTPRKTKPNAPPRSVTITCAAAHDGRLPVSVSAVPVEDLDAKGGVFVDFRLGMKVVDEIGKGLKRAARVGSILRGDEAVAAMVLREAAAGPDEATAGAAKPSQLPPSAKRVVPGAGAERPATDGSRLVSSQIAPPIRLSAGRSESMSAEVALPGSAAAEGQAWYVRARFATLGGKDLSSAWRRV